jgi:hypothetical protein
MDFWESAKGLAPELSRLALQLFGIYINLASVKRLWSNMGFLHSKRRNRLNISKFIKYLFSQNQTYRYLFILFYFIF